MSFCIRLQYLFLFELLISPNLPSSTYSSYSYCYILYSYFPSLNRGYVREENQFHAQGMPNLQSSNNPAN